MRAVVEAEGARAGRALAHARRSPIRNCSARSSRICGAGSPRWVSGGRKRTNRQSLSASGSAIASPSKIAVRVGRQFAGKDRRLGDAVEDLAADRLALFRHADDGVERLAAGPDLGLAGGADRGERDDVDLRPDPFGARDRLRRQRAQDRLQPVVARMMQMVGLGRREQDAVDARAEDRGEPRGAAGAEGAHDFGERVLEIGERGRAGVQRRQRVDQHDLPVEPGEMIAEERPHHMRLIGLVAALHHRRERAGRDRRRRRRAAIGAKVSAGEPSRSPGIRNRPGGRVESA